MLWGSRSTLTRGVALVVGVPCLQARLLRRQLEEAEAAKTQLHDEMAAVRSKKEAAELERHKLVLAHQTQAAAAHVQVRNSCSDEFPRAPMH